MFLLAVSIFIFNCSGKRTKAKQMLPLTRAQKAVALVFTIYKDIQCLPPSGPKYRMHEMSIKTQRMESIHRFMQIYTSISIEENVIRSVAGQPGRLAGSEPCHSCKRSYEILNQIRTRTSSYYLNLFWNCLYFNWTWWK